MPHSYVKIWVHAVFGTKYRKNLIVPGIKKQVHQLIIDEVKGLDCPLLAINSMPDHVHILFLLHRNKTIAEVMHQIKGASAYQINQQNLLPGNFAWQIGYGAFSVSESGTSKVKSYIKNQEIRYRKITFKEEYKCFAALHGFILEEGDVDTHA
jgi:REP element-mobilizing transposase RayT